MAQVSSDNSTTIQTGISVTLDDVVIRHVMERVIRELATNLDWPKGRIALNEHEAAEALGVPRHVLRDFRLSGRVQSTRIGRKVLYTRSQLLAALTGKTT